MVMDHTLYRYGTYVVQRFILVSDPESPIKETVFQNSIAIGLCVRTSNPEQSNPQHLFSIYYKIYYSVSFSH